MSLQVSTGFKSLILGPYSFKDIFDGGVIRIFTGSQPTNADAEEQGTLLGIITVNGGAWTAGSPENGLVFEQTGPYVGKPIGVPWVFTAIAVGGMGWFRMVSNVDDDGMADFVLPRIDGAIATTGQELTLPSTNVATIGQTNTIESFLYTIPPVAGV